MTNRARNFGFILYPDSMVEDAIKTLLREDFNVAISPLHCADDEDRKPHYHVAISFSGPKDYNDIDDYIRTKYKATHLIRLGDIRKHIRYLKHLDNPEKEQFETQDIESNYDIRKYIGNEVFIQDILRTIETLNIKSFADLTRVYGNSFNELEKISKFAYFFKTYLEQRNN